jgi:hypothetical protein
MKKILTVSVVLAAATGLTATFRDPGPDNAPRTWFHMIGGNVSRPGLTADLEAIAGAGIGGIQFFHGSGTPWPRTDEQIQCLSATWDDLVRFTADECRRVGLTFDMQNCPGWSMCGGPWIPHEKAMRRLVCFEPGRKPRFRADDDYRELFTLTFPRPAGFGEPNHQPVSVTGRRDERLFDFGKPVTVRSLTLPNPSRAGIHAWAYEPGVTFILQAETAHGWRTISTREMPRDAWQDDQALTFAVPETTAAKWRLTVRHRHGFGRFQPVFSPVARLDNWQALAGWCFRDFKAKGTPAVFGAPAHAEKATLVFGHVNMKRRNAPAPREATGWECDKLDPLGANAMFDAYIGRLAKGPLAGRLRGLLIDSWECGCQNWTWKMEEHFERLNGYALRPHLPAVFGYPVADAATTEKFLRDWRRTLSRLVEDNFYGTLAKRAHELGLTVQFETAFSDVVPGDALRYWKYADIPMCEFWQPHGNAGGYVYSDDFKPVRPCVSAAHVYGKPRVAAEALTSFSLTWDENFQRFKDDADYHLFRGVTHLVFHTYTHNPQTGERFLPPGTSFGRAIGTPFLRGQTWWRFMPQLTAYLSRCTYMLERGKPVVDVLWMLGDDTPYRPPENAPFPAGYKYDYCNADALVTRAAAKDGRIVFPDGMSYTALWIPDGTFLLPETEAKVAALAKGGAKVIRGQLAIDWPSQLDKLGFRPTEWYQRRDGKEDIFFVRLPGGETAFVTVADGKKTVLDPITGETRAAWRETLAARPTRPLSFAPVQTYPAWATARTYRAVVESTAPAARPVILSLGRVRDWAEVFVNGKKAAVLWCAPYVCDLTPLLKKGTNEVTVTVTSTWFNRLVRDASLPEKDRRTWVIAGPRKDAPLREAGLLGPATLTAD